MKRMAFLAASSFVLGVALTVVFMRATSTKVTQTSAPIINKDPYTMSFADLSSDLSSRQGDPLDHYTLYYLSSIDQNTIALLSKARSEAKHEELRAYADQIIQRRANEVDQLYAWQKTWGYSHH